MRCSSPSALLLVSAVASLAVRRQKVLLVAWARLLLTGLLAAQTSRARIAIEVLTVSSFVAVVAASVSAFR